MYSEVEVGLITAIRKCPEDAQGWLIYSDWLDENSQDTLANRIREQVHFGWTNDNIISILGLKLLLGRELGAVESTGEEVRFVTTDDEIYRLYHEQD